jgi:hypothetical protein
VDSSRLVHHLLEDDEPPVDVRAYVRRLPAGILGILNKYGFQREAALARASMFSLRVPFSRPMAGGQEFADLELAWHTKNNALTLGIWMHDAQFVEKTRGSDNNENEAATALDKILASAINMIKEPRPAEFTTLKLSLLLDRQLHFT